LPTPPKVEIEQFRWRAFGDYRWGFYFMVLCNTLMPLLFLFKKIRTTIATLFIISLIVNFGMWWERFVIIVGGVARGFSPHAWGLYAPTLIEYGIMSVSMTEMKETLDHGGSHAG
jgi:molybdopterin-containing oxidoreductase family membrane subunit